MCVCIEWRVLAELSSSPSDLIGVVWVFVVCARWLLHRVLFSWTDFVPFRVTLLPDSTFFPTKKLAVVNYSTCSMR